MKKACKLVILFLTSFFIFIFCVACSEPSVEPPPKDPSQDQTNNNDDYGSVACILPGERDDGDTYPHYSGLNAAKSICKIPNEKISFFFESESSAVDTCVDGGFGLIIAVGAQYDNAMYIAAKNNPDIIFVTIGGNIPVVADLPNLKSAYADMSQSSFVAGVVAGHKLENTDLPDNNFDSNGNIKVGYIAKDDNTENISAWTAYYLGIKYACDTPIAMDVKITQSRCDYDKEKSYAEYFVENGYAVIGQSTDTLAAATVAQTALSYGGGTGGVKCYTTGFNVDMLSAGYDSFLTSALADWSVYYEYLLKNYVDGEEIETDWAGGYADDAVSCTETMGRACAENTNEIVHDVETALKDGTLFVFDTSKFTVDGVTLSSAEIDLSYTNSENDIEIKGETKTALITSNSGITYFAESTLKSAPYFNYIIDGITII